jgi:hypothetical protein
MTLRTTFLSVAGTVALLSLAAMEWRLYHDVGALIASCPDLASHNGLQPQLDSFCTQQATVFRNSQLLRWIAIGLALLICGRMGAIWFQRKLQLGTAAILQQVQSLLARKSTKAEAPAEAPDPADVQTEEIARALATLEQQIDASLQRIETDAQRTSQAMISSRSVRDLQFIWESIRSAREVLEAARRHQTLPPRQTIEKLLFIEREVLALKKLLDPEGPDTRGESPPVSPGPGVPHLPDRDSLPPLETSFHPTNQG